MNAGQSSNYDDEINQYIADLSDNTPDEMRVKLARIRWIVTNCWPDEPDLTFEQSISSLFADIGFIIDP